MENSVYLYKEAENYHPWEKNNKQYCFETKNVSESSNNHIFNIQGVRKTNRRLRIYWENSWERKQKLLLEIWSTFKISCYSSGLFL